MTFGLGFDEFHDKTDPIGIVDLDVEPFGFLSTKSFSNSFTSLPVAYANSTALVVDIKLDDTSKIYERTAYTFFMLIRDVGGFNGAIIIFPTFLMSHFSANKYSQAVYKGVPIKKKNKQSVNQTVLRNQFAAALGGNSPPLDYKLMADEIKGQVYPKPKFTVLSSLRVLSLCKKDR